MPLNNQWVDEEIKKKIQNCLKQVKVETQHTKPFGMNSNQEGKLTEISTCIKYGGKTQVNNAMIQIRKLEKHNPKLSRREVTDQRRHKQSEENMKDNETKQGLFYKTKHRVSYPN